MVNSSDQVRSYRLASGLRPCAAEQNGALLTRFMTSESGDDPAGKAPKAGAFFYGNGAGEFYNFYNNGPAILRLL